MPLHALPGPGFQRTYRPPRRAFSKPPGRKKTNYGRAILRRIPRKRCAGTQNPSDSSYTPHSRGTKIIGNQWNVEMDRQTTLFSRTNTTRGPAHMGASRRQCIQHNVAEQWLNAIGPIQKDHRVANQCRCKGVLRSRSTSKCTDPRSGRKSIKCITKLLMNRAVSDPLKIQ